MRFVVLTITLLFSSTAVGQQPKAITNSIGMKLVLIHAGSFSMGSPKEEIGRQKNEKQHEVTISNSYYLGAYEVTQDEYEKVMGNNPSAFKGGKNPVDSVSWDEAVSFCKKLSESPETKGAGGVYRLPSEAEWEYACRAGSTTAYSFGDSVKSLKDYAWCGTQSDFMTHPVGEKKANQWGLYDMHGNAWEWCQDRDSSRRVARGGGLNDGAGDCRSAHRAYGPQSMGALNCGFRVAMSLPTKQPEPASSK